MPEEACRSVVRARWSNASSDLTTGNAVWRLGLRVDPGPVEGGNVVVTERSLSGVIRGVRVVTQEDLLSQGERRHVAQIVTFPQGDDWRKR